MRISKVDSNIGFKSYRMSKTRAEYFENEFKNAKSIDILTHESTDRDAVNSALVLSDYLDSLGVQSRIIVSPNVDGFNLKLKNQKIIKASDLDKDSNVDSVLCVDFSRTNKISQKNTLPYLMKADKIYCFDHHHKPDIGKIKKDESVVLEWLDSDAYIKLKKGLMKDCDPNPITPIYVDTTARSTTEIVYRYFEALNKEIDNTQAYNLLSGFVDDAQAAGYMKCYSDGNCQLYANGLTPNTYHIFQSLKSKLTDEQICEIAKDIDLMSSLTPEEENFSKSLYSRLQFSPNGKIAYVEIPSDDKEWIYLGMDNFRTSTILHRFRRSVINNDFNDPRLENIAAVFVFYRCDKDMYRMSAHSKEASLLDFFKYVQKNKIRNFTKMTGGYQERAGGGIYISNVKKCHNWTQAIISCDDFYDN